MGIANLFSTKTIRLCIIAIALAASAIGVSPSWGQQTGDRELPLVWVLATGGTIAAKGVSSTSLSEYKGAAILGQELVDAVPEIKKVANVMVEQFCNVGSPDITSELWAKLANRINGIFVEDPKVSGIVITHGTNTLEETAFFLNLTVKHNRPVVVVGSQRPATAISADGPLNLLNAIRTASCPEARGKGVLVVMNDEINAARDVTKTNTWRVETFRSPELGFLGYVDADKVAFYRASTKRHTFNSEFDVGTIKAFPKVAIVYSYAEPNTTVIHALLKDGVSGIVFAATGAGGLASCEKEIVKAVASSPSAPKPIMVLSTRVHNGRVISRKEYDDMGMIPADTLNPQKARILLMLVLTKTNDLSEIKRVFSEY
jgi:L-asparaginase